jgi:hypothetical protein
MGRLPPDPDAVPVEQRADEALEALSSATTTDPSLGPRQRRQSTISLRGSGSGSGSGSATTPNQPAPAPTSQDDFASDDEETEIISATLISFDVEATDPSPDPTNPASASGNGGAADATPGIWSAELRPNVAESTAHHSADGHGDHGPDCPHHNLQGQHEPAYRENVLTRLPAILATDVLAITPARLLMTPFAATVWLSLARPYMARAGMAMEGVVSGGAAWWWLGGLSSGRALVNLLGLELLLAVMHGEAWAVVMLMAERFRWSEEEWNEREGVGEDGEEEGQGQGEGDNI